MGTTSIQSLSKFTPGNNDIYLTEDRGEIVAKSDDAQHEISMYQGEIAPKEFVEIKLKTLQIVFPDIKNDYLTILLERMIANRFTKERIADAISSVIDNCRYKRPSIAEIISFDRKIRTYSYQEIANKCAPGYLAFDHFERVKISGKWRYIEKLK